VPKFKNSLKVERLSRQKGRRDTTIHATSRTGAVLQHVRAQKKRVRQSIAAAPIMCTPSVRLPSRGNKGKKGGCPRRQEPWPQKQKNDRTPQRTEYSNGLLQIQNLLQSKQGDDHLDKKSREEQTSVEISTSKRRSAGCSGLKKVPQSFVELRRPSAPTQVPGGERSRTGATS